jgi:hypothetical protein
MASQSLALERHDLETEIVKRSWQDEGFRREFIANPAGAFEKYLEIPAATLSKIAVHQEEPGTWHIVLPAKQANTPELSDRDLESITGGSTPVCAVFAVVAIPIAADTTVNQHSW